jgi:hypothetical protein
MVLALCNPMGVRAQEDKVIDDVEAGVTAEDAAILKRGKARVSTQQAIAQSKRVNNQIKPDVCNGAKGLVCVTGSGSVVVLPGANVNAPIINTPSFNSNQRPIR